MVALQRLCPPFLATLVDAGTGKVLAKTSEDPQAQATEKAGDAAAKR